MGKTLRILNVEDSPRDVDILTHHLSSAGYNVISGCVETAETMRAALEENEWDIILCDYSMPHLNALAALDVLRSSGLDIPFIIISGTVGEEVAVQAMLTGAHDYLPKGNLTRLVPAIERELHQAKNRRDQQQTKNERAAIFEIIQGSISTPNLDEFLKLVHLSISPIVYAENCIVMLHDPVNDIFEYEFWADKFDPQPMPRRVGKGFASYVLRTGQPLLLTAEFKKELIDRGETILSGTPSLSWLGVPLRTPARTIGVMVIQHYEIENAFSQRDLEFLSSVADQIALAIERKRSEVAMVESEERYRELVENAIDVIYTLDLEGNYTSINRAGEDLTGFTVEETLKRNIVDSIAPEYREKARRLLKAQVEGEDLSAFETEVVAKDGHRIVFEIKTRPIKENGVSVGLQGIARDITDRKRIAAALKESEANFKSLFNTANDAILVLNDGLFMACNPSAEILFGCGKEDIIDRSPLAFSPLKQPDGRLSSDKALEYIKAATSGQPQFFEWQHNRLDGTLFDAEVSLNRVDFGGTAQLQGTIRDISERKQAETAIRESTEKFHQLADNITDAFWIRSADFRELHYISPGFARIWGRSLESIYSKQLEWVEYIVSEDRERATHAYDQLRQGAGPLDVEYRISRPDNEIRWIHVRGFEVRDADNELIRYAGVVTDITETKQIEKEKEVALKRLKDAQRLGRIGDWEWNVAGRSIVWSPEVFEITGRDPLLGPPASYEEMASSYDSRSRAVLAENVEAAMESGEVREYELVVVRPDGERVYIQAVAEPKIDEDGQVFALAGTIQDISARKSAEAALSNSESRYHSLFENMIEGYAYCETIFKGDQLLDFIYTEVNGAFGTLTGLQNVVGKKVSDLIPGLAKSNPELFETYGRVALTGVPEKFETYVETLGIWLSITVYSSKRESFVAVFDNITERKVATAALNESDEKFHQLADNITDAFWIRSPDMSKIYYISPAYEQIWGRSLASDYANPKEWLEFIVPEDREAVRAAYAALMDDAPNIEIEYRIVRPDGEIRWVRARGFQVKDRSGKVIRLAGIITDVTERRSVIEALSDSENRYRTLFETSPDGVAMFDLQMNVLVANGRSADIFGYKTSDEMIGLNAFDLIAPENLKRARVNINGMLESGFMGPIESLGLKADGSSFPVEFSATLIRNSDGEPMAVLGVTRDIAERKRADEELRDSEERFSGAFMYAPIGVAMVSLDGHWLKVNRALCDLVGYSEPELLKLTFQDITYAEDLEIDLTNMQRLMDGEISSYQIEKRYLHKLGQAVSILLNVSLVRDKSGEPRYFISQIQDLTARKQLEEQFRQSQKMEAVGVLAGGIAHDFNNLLTAINGYSALTLKKMPPDDPFRHNIEEVKKAGDRAADLTAQLLAFSRKQVLKPMVLNLNSIIHNIENMLRRIIKESIELRVALEPTLGNIRADPGQIEQVIMNLAINARDAMPRGGTLTVETQNVYLDEDYVAQHINVTPGDFIKLTVTDTGEGMDAATQSRIFEPFFTTKDLGKGTGLGLSTVYGIVKQSGGDILVYSEPGHGTTFKLHLPCVDEIVQRPKWIGERKQTYAGTETILLVEDEDVVRNLIREILIDNGYKVLEASRGKEALQICETYEEPIHMLLTDVIMPRMGGSELKDMVVKLRPDIHVLFMSGYTDDAIAHRGIYDDEIEFIEKPFTPDALARKIREVFEY